MKTTTIDQNWTVRPTDGQSATPRIQVQPFPACDATVPGHVHLDLWRSGIAPHPFSERSEAGLAWVDESDWTYETSFDWNPDPRMPKRLLRFGGLDTVCEIFLNGQAIGSHDNFFVPLEIDVTELLRTGKNDLRIQFQSPVRCGEMRRDAYFQANDIPTNVAQFDERAFIRKPGYMSGWDWGPRLVSCGIWQPVELLEFRSRITSFSVLQRRLENGAFELTAIYEIDGDEVPVLAYNGVDLPAGAKIWTVNDRLWWPAGEGEQVLQDVSLRLPSGHEWRKRIGLRTLELVRESDAFGTSFAFRVNGRLLWTRGANWIPHDSFPGTVTAQDYLASIANYAKLGMNMLRVWGGGLYETDAFYDACDQEGLLVWQDFPYACSYYPDDQASQDIAREEAAANVHRLRDRTSLAIWCGNNENRSMWFGKWGGPERSPSRFYGEPIYDEVLKQVVADLDPARPYIESSPLLVDKMAGFPDAPEHSDDHYWDVWHGRGDWSHYKDSKTRFCSEFGFVSSCSMDAWRTVSQRKLAVTDPTVRWHDKTGKPWDVYYGLVNGHYAEPNNLEDWIYRTQLNQRDAMRAALEHYRGGEFCRGALIWQANDCWPVQSWALEDYQRLIKPAGWELRRIFAPRLICANIEAEVLQITLANDSEEPLTDQLSIQAFDVSNGKAGVNAVFAIEVSAQSRAKIGEFPTRGLPAARTAIRCRIEGLPDLDRWVLLAEPKDAECGAPADLRATLRENRLELTGEGLVLDLVVWDDCNAATLADPETGMCGFRAVSGVNPRLVFHFAGDPANLRARSLAGFHVLRFDDSPNENPPEEL